MGFHKSHASLNTEIDKDHLSLLLSGLQRRWDKQLCWAPKECCVHRELRAGWWGVAQPMVPCQQPAPADPITSFGYHYGFPGGKNLLLLLSLARWQNSVAHLSCMPLRLTGLFFRFLSPHSFQIHLSQIYFHLEMMLLPAVSCVCHDHQTLATQINRSI